jgi:hypothetical protein
MSRMGSHDSFSHFKHKIWPKEGPGVKLAIWLPPTKSQESPWFPCMQVASDILLESSRRGLQLCFSPHLNRRSVEKVMGPQSRRSPKFGTKCHLDVGFVERHRVYYKGEGGGFPQVRAVVNLVNLVSLNLPMARRSTKNVLTM